jgi:hypothetical protein
MQSHAGLLYLAKSTGRILLILENSRWTVPTFPRSNGLIKDAESLLNSYCQGRIIPIELYLSADRGFEYGTYVCIIEEEFLTIAARTCCWADLDLLPNQLHTGLKSTLNNSLIKTKIETIMELERARIN